MGIEKQYLFYNMVNNKGNEFYMLAHRKNTGFARLKSGIIKELKPASLFSILENRLIKLNADKKHSEDTKRFANLIQKNREIWRR